MRRKNPHPKRAVNARTVLKASTGRREEGEEEGEKPLVLCMKRIPEATAKCRVLNPSFRPK